jgi:hypothetical protein
VPWYKKIANIVLYLGSAIVLPMKDGTSLSDMLFYARRKKMVRKFVLDMQLNLRFEQVDCLGI